MADNSDVKIPGLDLADNQSDSIDPAARLDSISDEFKGILMDIHSSMMTDAGDENENPLVSNPLFANNVSDPIQVDGEDIMAVTDFSTSDTNIQPSNAMAQFAEDSFANDFMPNENEMIQGLGTTAEQWKDIETLQIPEAEGSQAGFTSFCTENKKEEIKTETEVKEEVDDAEEEPDPPHPIDENESKIESQTKIKLFVANIPTGFKSDNVRELFAPYGTVIHCEVFSYKNFAYVHLDDLEGGLKAIKELHNQDICGSKIRVTKSTTDSVVAKQESMDQEVRTFKIYVSGMKKDFTKEDVYKLLEEYGRVIEVELFKTKGAFVHMEEEEAGRKVIAELNGKLLPGYEKRVIISVAKNPEGPSLPTIKLEIKNIAEGVSAAELRSLFQPYGFVTRCTLTDSKFDLFRKAVVHLDQLGDIRSALKDLNEHVINDKKLIVEAMLDRPALTRNPISKNSKSVPNVDYSALAQTYDAAYASTSSSRRGSKKGASRRGSSFHRGGFPSRGRGFPLGPPVPVDRFQLIPMPSVMEVPFMPRGHNRRGMMGGRSRGMPPGPRPGMIPRYPKRPFENNYIEDYGFDEYYQDPVAAGSRDHYAAMEEGYNQQQQDYFNSSFGYPPPEKVSKRGKKGKNRGSRGGGITGNGYGGGGKIPSLFDPTNDYDDYQNYQEPINVPYQSHPYPSYNLPLGEREYFRNPKKEPKTKAYQQNPYDLVSNNNKPQTSMLQQHHKRQQQLQQNQGTEPDFTSDYFVPDQIPASSLPDGGFDCDLTTAYPSNYYQGMEGMGNVSGGYEGEGMDGFNAVPFDYNNIKKRNSQQLQPSNKNWPDGVNPNDFPLLNPNCQVYVNQVGKVMVRGIRGGKNKKKKARRPGLGSKKGNGGGGNEQNPNAIPIGGQPQPLMPTQFGGTQKPRFGGGGGGGNKQRFNNNKRFKNKQEIKQDNQEYSDWLQSKAWLHQSIPGTVKPAANNNGF